MKDNQMSKIRVLVEYRRYKKLHALFESYIQYPPTNIEYTIPAPIKVAFWTKLLYKLYFFLGDNVLVQRFLSALTNRFFVRGDKSKQFDLIEYIQLVPSKRPNNKYVVSMEHVGALFGFSRPTDDSLQQVSAFLQDTKCLGIICMSNAARQTIENYWGEESDAVMKKARVIYPAVPNYVNLYGKRDSSKLIANSNSLKLVFVGNQVYRKGLHELLKAYVSIASDVDAELYVVSDAPAELRDKYRYSSIHYLEPKFTKEDIIKTIFLPADIFIMPTHYDTFGMVYLDALASGTAVIATDQFAGREIISHERDGLLLHTENAYFEKNKVLDRKSAHEFFNESYDEELVVQITASLKRLANEPQLLKSMKETALLKFAKGGKFSIEKRNERLVRMYHGIL